MTYPFDGVEDVILGGSSPARFRVPSVVHYNPIEAGDGIAACLWELLRRNPAFRLQALGLFEGAYPHGLSGQVTESSEQFVAFSGTAAIPGRLFH